MQEQSQSCIRQTVLFWTDIETLASLCRADTPFFNNLTLPQLKINNLVNFTPTKEHCSTALNNFQVGTKVFYLLIGLFIPDS